MLDKIPAIFKNKYALSIMIFLVWLSFFDANNLVERYKMLRKIGRLNSDIQYFNERIKYNRDKLRELNTDNNTLEKFAREQYLMKKDNEDIFLIEEPSRTYKPLK